MRATLARAHTHTHAHTHTRTHTPASGYYELKPGNDNSVVTVDGMVSPLITLQYGTVRSDLNT